MTFQIDDTIAALASAAGPAGRGIVRVSGPAAVSTIDDFYAANESGERDSPLTSVRRPSVHHGALCLRGLRVPLGVLIYVWPGQRSYTGQQLVEIHAPGSPPLLEAILAELFERGVRPAGPGEFTLRAFLSGRIDLVQAEAVLAAIDAADGAQLETALRQMAGGISGRLAQVRVDLLNLLADLEAGLDFVEDIQFVSPDGLCRRVIDAKVRIDSLLDQCNSRGQSTGRRRIVLGGLPNAGKSTLFNALLQREAALISAQAGTTRDYLRGQADWHGLAVDLIDTPGCEGSERSQRGSDDILREAYRLGREQWDQADLLLWCTAADRPAEKSPLEAELIESLQAQKRHILFVRTKADLALATCDLSVSPDAHLIEVSATAGRGLEDLIGECVQRLAGPNSGASEMAATTQARCRESLHHSSTSLGRALDTAERRAGDELVALEIREALDHLGRVLGAVFTEDILDRIFSRFCIGK